MRSVTITEGQRRKFSRKGNNLIKRRLTSGFQLEDHNPHTSVKRKIIYGHDNPSHLRTVQNTVGGRIYPRESYYRWDSSWTADPNTTLMFNKTLAYGKEGYLESRNIRKSRLFFESKTVSGRGKSIKGSWVVPDVRLYNTDQPTRNFKNAYLITKKIDYNSRMSMVVKSKKKVREIRKRLKYERVKKIDVQDYKPKKHSFFNFIS
jgi:hypothetical protein